MKFSDAKSFRQVERLVPISRPSLIKICKELGIQARYVGTTKFITTEDVERVKEAWKTRSFYR